MKRHKSSFAIPLVDQVHVAIDNLVIQPVVTPESSQISSPDWIVWRDHSLILIGSSRKESLYSSFFLDWLDVQNTSGVTIRIRGLRVVSIETSSACVWSSMTFSISSS